MGRGYLTANRSSAIQDLVGPHHG
jgi:hypothetical protein